MTIRSGGAPGSRTSAATAAGITRAETVGSAPTLIGGPESPAVTNSTPRWIAVSAWAALGRNTSPAAVSRTRRPSRRNRAAPSISSSSWIALVTAGWLTCRVAAAFPMPS